MNDENSLTIEKLKLNERLNQVEITLARIEEKISNHLSSFEKIFKDMNGRVRILERVFWMGLGALGLMQIALRFWK